jgi:hypothetical protein
MRGKRSKETKRLERQVTTVVKKLILPRIEEIPAKCKEKIAKSTDTPE